tara:strand:+ start:12465 stop:12686 length:222 start_codon:yes stop_codon:yes gene_type:complete
MLHNKIGNHGTNQELINWLEDTFPDKIPPLRTTLEDLRYLQGQQKVIDLIKSTYEAEPFETEDNNINILNVPN